MSQRSKLGLLLAASALCLPVHAGAETLRDALLKAYNSNPTLTGARAGQRANDENVPIARSTGLPNVSVSGLYNENVQNTSLSAGSLPGRTASGTANLSVPIFLGGAVSNAVGGAKARVESGQADLRSAEANVFTAVVAGYMDVIRTQAIVDLNRKQVRVLTVNLQATRDRFEVGDLTRTDVAQSEARLALAQAQLQQAESQLIAAKENYVQLVGTEPDALDAPPALPNLPSSPDTAVAVALKNNPDLISAARARDAARYDVGVARATRLPKLYAVGSSSYTDNLNSLPPGLPSAAQWNSYKATTAGAQLTIPIFQGGGPSARIRQAQARQSQAIEREIAVERGVIASARSAFANWQASNQVIKSAQIAVQASTLALEGVRAENSVGTRTILDVLNAERELLNAQVDLVTAQRNSYVAGFQLLAAMGRAEARDLGLDGGPLYDPTTNYRRVHGIYWDWDQDPKPAAKATRTVDSKPQTSDISAPPAK
ncbi:MAG: TolC family outer membrane protein [Alphaproteobacteria bacterium]|nr:TolC family outer membrane protein [Alphaproteobacteria bacterium]